jgi:hypothetical protein
MAVCSGPVTVPAVVADATVPTTLDADKFDIEDPFEAVRSP